MLLHAHQEAGSAEGAAADFQVPSSIPPSTQHAHAVRPQVRFHGLQPLVLLPPMLTPHGGGDGPERPRPSRAPPPPRREAFLNAPAQPRDGLNQVQHRGQAVAPQPPPPPPPTPPIPGAPPTP